MLMNAALPKYRSYSCKPGSAGSEKALTLTELIVVLVILSLLAAIAIPVFVHRAAEAKLRSTQQEVREIASAEELCGLTHGIYVPIQVLDDIPNDTSNYQYPDEIRNETGVYVIDTLTPVNDQINNQTRLSDNTAKMQRVRELWQGPFLNPKRVFESTASGTTQARRDYPLDPWGQPYRIYSPLGIVGSGAQNLTSFDTDSFSDGRLTTLDRRFDRFTIVSFGPDNEPGALNDPGDDIFYYFGTVMSETSYANMFF
jgi:prepilin-type N-terminal cleavage/methylation domain-containing protein